MLSEYLLNMRAIKLGIKEAPIKEKKPIAKVSKKRKVTEAEYTKIKKQYLKDHPNCECGRPECKRGKATDIHHMAGRIADRLIDTNYFLAVSRACHLWIEAHPVQAKEMGLSVSRLKKTA